jgi:hypothetical protein
VILTLLYGVWLPEGEKNHCLTMVQVLSQPLVTHLKVQGLEEVMEGATVVLVYDSQTLEVKACNENGHCRSVYIM